MKYRVTGGADGQSGISVGSRRYEAGDIVEMTQPKAQWLVDRGLLEATSGRSSTGKTAAKLDEQEPVDDPVEDLPVEDEFDSLDDEGDEV